MDGRGRWNIAGELAQTWTAWLELHSKKRKQIEASEQTPKQEEEQAEAPRPKRNILGFKIGPATEAKTDKPVFRNKENVTNQDF